MYKNAILILILLFSFQAINAQKIFYSEKLNDRFDFTRSNVIGKVKNNIIILKYGESFKKAELLIYDYNMHFKGSVPFDIINSGDLAKLDFVIRGNVFDAIAQYYTSNHFYCKIARFNDEGQLLNGIQTIDSANTKTQGGAEIYHVVKSENNEQVILMRTLTGIKLNSLQLEYKFINSKFKIDHEKKYLVPFNDDIQLSQFYLNNSGDLLFCEFVPNSNDQNAILFYKIPKYSDTAINSVQFIGSNRPTDVTIAIDNDKKEYLINGLFYENPDEDLVTATFAQSIYYCLFDDDLVIKGRDTTIEVQQVNGLEATALNNMLLVNSGNSNNNGYYITCAGMRSAGYQMYQTYETPNYASVVSASELLTHPPYPYGGRLQCQTQVHLINQLILFGVAVVKQIEEILIMLVQW